ncbi:MAG: hypothetical protein MI741_14200 [Rhodospirillales bacterium]|nr:hypothetical protein [Rhodospirillales bacterium]
MPKNAEIAANLLRAAAKFFRAFAEDNPNMRDQMLTNAETYEAVAQLVGDDPNGVTELDDALGK